METAQNVNAKVIVVTLPMKFLLAFSKSVKSQQAIIF